MNKSLSVFILLFLIACSSEPLHQECDGYVLLKQDKGPALGYSPHSGVQILTQGSRCFKDLNRNGQVDVYEDWRCSSYERAVNLASLLPVEDIAGLMLHSRHITVLDSELTAHQEELFFDRHMRHVLITKVESPEIAARWSNNLQARLEATGFGVPANNSSDPRHTTASADDEFTSGSGGKISKWPRDIGMAATFDPELIRRQGEIMADELRCMGMTTYLGPQIDMLTDPRWKRSAGTYGEEPRFVADVAAALVEAMQQTPGSRKGWGNRSVNTMAKHWPGAGSGEGGRESHHLPGKYAVYPGNNFDGLLYPFLNGAFATGGRTGCTSAVMPSYNICYGIDPTGANVGNNHSRYMLTDLLREKYGFDGVICTDWSVTKDTCSVNFPWFDTGDDIKEAYYGGKSFGVEHMTVPQRHFNIIEAGADQFGGSNDWDAVMDAYRMWCAKYGKESAEKRFRKSAVRLLVNMFNVGLFENPYIDLERSKEVVGCPEYMEEGYKAMQKSIIMLKNAAGVLPLSNHDGRRLKVYMPERHYPAAKKFFDGFDKETIKYPVSLDILDRYYDFTSDPDSADFAFVQIHGPETMWGYSVDDVKAGGNGYLPISLQYSDYTAEHAREHSIAGDRSYKGKTVWTYNKGDMDQVRQVRELIGDKPLILSVSLKRGCVLSEVEPYADAVLVSFGVLNQAILDVVSGAFEPYGLLPLQMPADMKTVELQCEDVPRDMECYRDSEGNVYDFGFGMNWRGVIKDSRVRRYM